MRWFFAAVAAVAAGAVLSGGGCASIMSGPTSEVKVSSNPPGARFEVAGTPIAGVTPAVVKLQNWGWRRYEFKFRAEGYETLSVQPRKVLNPYFWANFLLVDPTGFIVDATWGGMFKYDDAGIVANLKRIASEYEPYTASLLEATPAVRPPAPAPVPARAPAPVIVRARPAATEADIVPLSEGAPTVRLPRADPSPGIDGAAAGPRPAVAPPPRAGTAYRDALDEAMGR